MLPSGTVTLLFTDIEGSTRLLQELGQERFNEALSEHRKVFRKAFAAHNGFELRTEGDSFFAAFPSARDAVAAAGQAQEELAPGPLRVRVGLHTGEPLQVEHEDGYVGLDVHLAARICAAAHGGQVLLSQATRGNLDDEVELRDLRAHRLKDFEESVSLYQLGRERFPPLRTLHQTNLPAQPNSLIGREREIGEVDSLLRKHRLVTLSGPGGTGKTRLAIDAAAELLNEFPDGVWFVPLAPLRDPALVVPTIAQTLGLRSSETLETHLADKRALLLLDNFEHLLDAAPRVAELLGNAVEVKVLATSRECLHLSGEHEYQVLPLTAAAAVALFVERARAATSSFEPDEQVAEICQRLDDLPLAVELAAARAKALAPSQILARLKGHLELLPSAARDVPERQRTLEAAIGWSYELLEERERELFARLSVFAGGFELDEAELVADADVDTLSSLIDKSLVRRTEDGRFFLLETVRQYAADRLGTRAAKEARRRHADRFAALAEHAADGMAGADAANWARRTECELNNLRSAIDWAASVSDPETELRIVVALRQFWRTRGDATEGSRRVEQALEHAVGRQPALRAKALGVASMLASICGRYERGAELAEEGVALAESVGDDAIIAGALSAAANSAMALGQYERAKSLHEESRSAARRAGDKLQEAMSVNDLVDVALSEGEYEAAEELAGRAVQLFEEIEARDYLSIATYNLASVLLMKGEIRPAERFALGALELAGELLNTSVVGFCMSLLAAVALRDNSPISAARLVGASEALLEQAGSGFFGGVEQRVHEDNVARLEEQFAEPLIAQARASGRENPQTEVDRMAARSA